MVYRDMTMADIPHVIPLMQQLQCDQARYDTVITVNSPSYYMLEAILQGVLENELQAVYIATDGETIRGYIFGWICRERTAYSPLENYLYISDAYLVDEYRGKGIYNNLLTILETWALTNKCSNAMCEMYVNNKPIQNIMAKNSYHPYKTQFYKKLSCEGDKNGTDK